MKQFFALFLMAVTVEGTVTYLRTWFVDKHFQWQQALTCCLGIFLAFVYKLDYIELFEIEGSLPYVGNVLTGIAISRGSNVLYDFLKKIINYQSVDFKTEVTGEEAKG